MISLDLLCQHCVWSLLTPVLAACWPFQSVLTTCWIGIYADTYNNTLPGNPPHL